MNDILMSSITPAQAMGMYEDLITDNDQAASILMLETEAGVFATALYIDEQTSTAQAIAVAALDKLTRPAKAALLSSETWERSIGPGEDVESINEGVVFSYVDASGAAWTATRRFVRTNEGVRWVEPEMNVMLGHQAGQVPAALALVVGLIADA